MKLTGGEGKLGMDLYIVMMEESKRCVSRVEWKWGG